MKATEQYFSQEFNYKYAIKGIYQVKTHQNLIFQQVYIQDPLSTVYRLY